MKNMNIFYNGTYREDYELFDKLGLSRFDTNNKEEIFVGEYKLPYYEYTKIKIYVSFAPAQFWRFYVETEDGKKINIETGSGSLSDYWNMVLKVAEDMFIVEKITDDEETKYKKDLINELIDIYENPDNSNKEWKDIIIKNARDKGYGK